jgi:hypothetical protein
MAPFAGQAGAWRVKRVIVLFAAARMSCAIVKGGDFS